MIAGFDVPKPIQEQAIPPFLAGRDVLGVAQTGSGKTAAFSLPILTKIVALGTRRLPKTARALILAPTRELAVQIEETIRILPKGLHISTALVLGGVSRSSQVRKIAPGVDVLVATPGRLTDLVREGDISLSETRWLVLDEADRMLDMGFINDVRRIAKAVHRDKQTALFSATMPEEIEQLARGIMKDPVHVEVAPAGHDGGRDQAGRRDGAPQAEAQGSVRHAGRRGDELGDRVRTHQARRRPRGARPRARRLQRCRHPRQQEPERPPEGAERLPRRFGAHSGRNRYRGARHRRARHQPCGELRPARRSRELRPPHRPHRPQRRRRHRDHAVRSRRRREAARRSSGSSA